MILSIYQFINPITHIILSKTYQLGKILFFVNRLVVSSIIMKEAVCLNESFDAAL